MSYFMWFLLHCTFKRKDSWPIPKNILRKLFIFYSIIQFLATALQCLQWFTFSIRIVLYGSFLYVHKFNTHSKHDWKVKFWSFFIAICWYCQYPQFVKQLVSFSQIMGIFNTYDLLPQSYKALPSNDTFCKYWVYET